MDKRSTTRAQNRMIHKLQEGAQVDFVASGTVETFTGGQAGGGKSFGLLHDFIRDVKNPDASGILFRRTYPDLEDLIHKAIQHYKGLNPTFNSAKHQFVFPSGARLKFSHLQHVKSIYSHSGQEYTHEYWDELPQFPMLPYTYMMSRLRSVSTGILRRVKSTGNPDGEGVTWVRDRFVRKLKPREIGFFKTINGRDTRVTPSEKGAVSRMWIPTIRAENIALMENNPEYESMLDQLPEDKKIALKYGSWETQDKVNQLILSPWWDKAILGENLRLPGIHAIGADYAVSGDKCAVCWGVGNVVKGFAVYPGMMVDDFGKIVYQKQNELGKFRTVAGIDSIGPGVGVFHYLKKTDISNLVIPCQYKDKNFNSDLYAYKMHFDNWRSQAWWKFKEDMERGRIDLSELTGKEGFFDDLYKLQEEVVAHTAKQEGPFFKVVSKQTLKTSDFLGRSPDMADALVMWNWVRERQLPSGVSQFQNFESDYEALKILSSDPYSQSEGESVAWT